MQREEEAGGVNRIFEFVLVIRLQNYDDGFGEFFVLFSKSASVIKLATGMLNCINVISSSLLSLLPCGPWYLSGRTEINRPYGLQAY